MHLALCQLDSGQVLPVMHLQVATRLVFIVDENLVYLECYSLVYSVQKAESVKVFTVYSVCSLW